MIIMCPCTYFFCRLLFLEYGAISWDLLCAQVYLLWTAVARYEIELWSSSSLINEYCILSTEYARYIRQVAGSVPFNFIYPTESLWAVIYIIIWEECEWIRIFGRGGGGIIRSYIILFTIYNLHHYKKS